MILTSSELTTLKILLDSLINSHKKFNTKIKKSFVDVNEKFKSLYPNLDFVFVFAPTKGGERAFIKLSENINENNKIPLNTLKDLSRGT